MAQFLSMIVHRKSLLARIPDTAQSCTVRATFWEEWEPPITRWFDEDFFSTSLTTTTTRQTYVRLIFTEDDGAVVVILNFNQNHVRLANVCGNVGMPLRFSDPVVPYRETVTAESSMVAISKSPNKHNRLSVKAMPVGKELVSAIERGFIDFRDDVKARARIHADDFAGRFLLLRGSGVSLLTRLVPIH